MTNQGTATNNSSDQTTRQRDKFVERNESKASQDFQDNRNANLGVNKTATKHFAYPDILGEKKQENYDGFVKEINKRAKLKLSVIGIAIGDNPDFNGGIKSHDLFRFARGSNKFNKIKDQDDNPRVFGPNLIPPEINNVTSPTKDEEGIPISKGSPTSNQENTTVQSGNSYKTKGFGIDFEYNDPRGNSRHVPYLDNNKKKLGEHFDTDLYEYNDIFIDTKLVSDGEEQ
jgi:hypothetical protein